jgi:hypothetical protein
LANWLAKLGAASADAWSIVALALRWNMKSCCCGSGIWKARKRLATQALKFDNTIAFSGIFNMMNDSHHA